MIFVSHQVIPNYIVYIVLLYLIHVSKYMRYHLEYFGHIILKHTLSHVYNSEYKNGKHQLVLEYNI